MRILGSEFLEILLQHSCRDILTVVVLHKCPGEAEVALANKEYGIFGRERNGWFEIPGMSFRVAATRLGLWCSGLVGWFLVLSLSLVRGWLVLLRHRLAFF